MSFSENGYHIVKNFLHKDFVDFINQYFFNKIISGKVKFGDVQSPNSYACYGDLLMDTILSESAESLSKITDIHLLPTYSYTRLYGKGDELVIHRDRPSCEISATLALGIPENEEINPLFFSKNEDKTDSIKIILEPGDLCIYRGCDLYHWRETFTQKWYLQSFLHYVNANGPYKNNIYDGRNALGIDK